SPQGHRPLQPGDRLRGQAPVLLRPDPARPEVGRDGGRRRRAPAGPPRDAEPRGGAEGGRRLVRAGGEDDDLPRRPGRLRRGQRDLWELLQGGAAGPRDRSDRRIAQGRVGGDRRDRGAVAGYFWACWIGLPAASTLICIIGPLPTMKPTKPALMVVSCGSPA